jgi:hypothetical protein
MNDWLNALLKPLSELYQTFIAFKNETLYELSITGQVISLEQLLNDKFNGGLNAWNWNSTDGTYVPNTPNAIYIIDFPNALPVTYVWNNAEARPPLYLYNASEAHTPPLYLYNMGEFDDEADFLINVPTALADVTTDLLFVAKMKAWVNKYRQAGTRYSIVNY